jgi:hypothetical protein
MERPKETIEVKSDDDQLNEILDIYLFFHEKLSDRGQVPVIDPAKVAATLTLAAVVARAEDAVKTINANVKIERPLVERSVYNGDDF